MITSTLITLSYQYQKEQIYNFKQINLIMKYNKLIRDKIPEIVKEKGKIPLTHIATDEEYKQKLYEKLKEETEEFLEKPSNEELSDILEVIHSICKLNNLKIEDLELLRKKKAKERGSFNNHIILDEVK